jgi:uncharacterized membrane protein
MIDMHNEPQVNETREKKRAQFADAPKKSRLTPILLVVVVALVAVIAYVILTDSGGGGPAATTSLNAASGDVKIPLSDLGNQAKFFDFSASGKQVRFFVLKSSDGVYRAAMDACDTCWHAKKGYRQEGDEMVCNNCGLKFHSKLINEVAGGCNPIGLPCRVEGDQIVIKSSDIEGRSRYF